MVMFNFATTTLGRHEEHEIIFEALKSGNLRQASQIAAAHTRQATQTLLELMNAIPPANKSIVST
jgi:DNA-binding GntR family transcriptional regulator